VTATTVMAVAILLYVITRWAHNKPAVSIGGVISGLFVILVIAMLDQGKTEQVAKGFAWLFFIVAAYNAIPPITAAAAKSGKSGAGQIRDTLI
jgi:hypothetical protein